ncbi:MAG: YitT family protein [Lachnospiraceae bacterium]|nr:YitT family protein [Lachnospiraceae bacterium]
MKTKNILGSFISVLLIILGALLASFSVACILLPNDAIDYGTAGIAIIVSKLTGFNLSLCVLFIFIPFVVGGFFVLGVKFSIKAIIGSLAYTLGLAFFEKLSFELNTEHFIAVAFGGALLGIGLSLILKSGGCIDGSEILANIILKKVTDKTGRNYSMMPILVGFNLCVYTAVFLLIDKNASLLSLLVYIVATVIIDRYTDHFEAIKQVTIITKDEEELINAIRFGLNKTCTIIESKGAIAGENKTLFCYVNYFELQKLRDIIQKNKGTFSTVTTIDEIIR